MVDGDSESEGDKDNIMNSEWRRERDNFVVVFLKNLVLLLWCVFSSVEEWSVSREWMYVCVCVCVCVCEL